MLELIDGFLTFKAMAQGRSGGTVEKYRCYLKRLATFLDGKDPAKATTQDLDEFAGAYAHKAGLSPRSRRALVAAVRGFYAWMVRDGRIRVSPAVTLPYPKAGQRLPIAMSLSNAEKLMMAPDVETFLGSRDAAIIGILIGCGVRISGLVGLNQEALIQYEENDRIHLTIKVKEKGGKERLVPVPREAAILIQLYVSRPELDVIDRTLPDGQTVLFVSINNRGVPEHDYIGEARRISTRSVNDMIIKHGESAGIPRSELHPHAMRHLYGTELAEGDVDLLVRQALMGHVDPRSAQVYTRLAHRKLRDAAEKSNPLSRIRSPGSQLARIIDKGAP